MRPAEVCFPDVNIFPKFFLSQPKHLWEQWGGVSFIENIGIMFLFYFEDLENSPTQHNDIIFCPYRVSLRIFILERVGSEDTMVTKAHPNSHLFPGLWAFHSLKFCHLSLNSLGMDFSAWFSVFLPICTPISRPSASVETEKLEDVYCLLSFRLIGQILKFYEENFKRLQNCEKMCFVDWYQWSQETCRVALRYFDSLIVHHPRRFLDSYILSFLRLYI